MASIETNLQRGGEDDIDRCESKEVYRVDVIDRGSCKLNGGIRRSGHMDED